MTIQDIYTYLENIIGEMNQSGNSILTEVEVKIFEKHLLDIIQEINTDLYKLSSQIDGTNKVVISYAGNFEGINIYKFVNSVCQNSNGKYGYITDTEMGNIINESRFNESLAIILESGSANLKNVINNVNKKISERFIEVNASGDVLAIVSTDELLSKVWYNTELEILLNKSDVNTINNVSRLELLDYYNAMREIGLIHEDALLGVATYIQMTSAEVLGRIEVRVAEDGTIDYTTATYIEDDILTGGSGSNFLLDYSKVTCELSIVQRVFHNYYRLCEGMSEIPAGLIKYTKAVADIVGKSTGYKLDKISATELQFVPIHSEKGGVLALTSTVDTVKVDGVGYSLRVTTKKVNDFAGEEPSWGKANYTQFITKSGEVIDITTYMNIRTGMYKIVGTIGTITILYDAFTDDLPRAFQAYSEGNYEEGNKIVGQWAGGTCGGLIAAKYAVEAAFPFCAALAATGPWGVVGAIIIEAAVGGIAYCIGSELGQAIGDVVADGITAIENMLMDLVGVSEESYRNAKTARVNVDPLVIDLNNDGFQLLSKENGVYFDFDINNMAEKSGWISKSDAFLVFDRNNDGTINNGGELFGDSTILSNGKKADSGFQALADMDENKDGKIDVDDSIFSKLKIWQDLNEDGITTENELFSLPDLDIASINLNTTIVNKVDGETNAKLIKTAEVVFGDGRKTTIGEFTFDSNLYDTREVGSIDISKEILGLPDIRAIGNMLSLHSAMALDKSGELKQLVNDFSKTTTISERESIMTQILYFCSGADKILSGSRGYFFDAKKLKVIECMMGMNYVGTNGTNPNSGAAPILLAVYNELFETYYNQLNIQTHLQPFSNLMYVLEKDGVKSINTELFNNIMKMKISAGIDVSNEVAEVGRYVNYLCKNSEMKGIDEFIKFYIFHTPQYLNIIHTSISGSIVGTNENNSLYGTASSDFIVGLDGNDLFYGGLGDDILSGGNGIDKLYGQDGNDTLYGGTGNDQLEGGNGDDVLYGGTGDDLLYGSAGNDMYLRNKETGDEIRVYYAYYNHDINYYLEKIEFADGTIWGNEDLREKTSIRYGGTANDTLCGIKGAYQWKGDETFYAGAGNDTVNGGDGDDLIYGEVGNDNLNGQDGNDTLYGGEGIDSLNGGAGADTYVFQKGDGSDTINNYDVSVERKEDRILFGEGIRPEDIEVSRIGNDMYLRNKETGDEIRVYYAYYDLDINRYLEKIEFADGTVWGNEYLRKKLNTWYGGDGNDIIRGVREAYQWNGDETFYAGGGNDEVYGGDGDDVIYGEAGNDKLEGGTGDDILYGGAGDDRMYGEVGNDLLYGETGDDSLYGGFGNDLLFGSTGNDKLEGGYGADTYVFYKGDGSDTINNYDVSVERKEDRILFGEGICPENIEVSRIGNDMYLRNKETGDEIRVYYAYYDLDINRYLEKIEFADGTVWGNEYLREKLNTWYGGDGNDIIRGVREAYQWNGDETFYAGGGNDEVYGGDGDDVIYGEAGNDKLEGGTGDDILYGGAGDDRMYGEVGNDLLYGETGDDSLYGGFGNDLLFGSTGNDKLEGGYGADTYVFQKGDGSDTINNYDVSVERKEDRILFGEGIRPEDIEVSRIGNDMYLRNKETGDEIRVYYAYYDLDINRYLEKIEFADGTIWGNEYLREKLSTWYGGDGNDIIRGVREAYQWKEDETFYAGGGNDEVYGGDGDDVIYGEAGNDKLEGGTGDDSLYGGAGDDSLNGGGGDDLLYGGEGIDSLNGGAGADTYVFQKGDGIDTIHNFDTGEERKEDRILFGKGIRPEDIEVSRRGADMYLRNKETGDEIRIYEAYYFFDIYRFLEKVEFADGTIWGIEELRERASIRYGGAGNDILYGISESYQWKEDETFYSGAGNDTVQGGTGDDVIYGEAGDDTLCGQDGNDTLYGGTGNDKLVGGIGDDIYLFGIGDGVDTIIDNAGNSQIKFLNNIIVSDIKVGLSGSRNLELSINGTEDKIIISDYFYNSTYQNYTLSFEDGTEASIDAVNMKLTWEDEVPESEVVDVHLEFDQLIDNSVTILEQIGQSDDSSELWLDPNNSNISEEKLVVEDEVISTTESNENEVIDDIIVNEDVILEENNLEEGSTDITSEQNDAENPPSTQENMDNHQDTSQVIQDIYEECNEEPSYTTDEYTNIQVLQVVDAISSCNTQSSVVTYDFGADNNTQAGEMTEMWVANG